MWAKVGGLLSQRLLPCSPYCVGVGLVIYEKEKWESMSFGELARYLQDHFHMTSKAFSSKSDIIDFLDGFESCVHKDKQQVIIQESVAAERKWINNYITYGQRINAAGAFIDECKSITKTQNNLKKQYALNQTESSDLDDSQIAINIDNSYWEMYQLLNIPNSSMSCAQNIIFVLFHTLTDIIKDISNENKYDHLVNNSFLEKKNENKLNILDIGCGVGLIGQSIAHFYPYFDDFKQHFGNKNGTGFESFDDTFNLFGFDHSIKSLEYGKAKYPKYLNQYNEIFLGDINDNEFMDDYISKQTNDGLYDIIIASDVLFQAPINGIVGIEAIKKCFKLLKPGGFLIAGSPVQRSSPCLNDAYNQVLKSYFEEKNIRCILYDEVVKAETDIGLDETHILIKMYYKQPSTKLVKMGQN